MTAGGFTANLRVLFAREIAAFEREVERFPDDAVLWKTLPGIANSAGNLAAHVCGNLQHYIGHMLGGTDYVRNREYEFGRRTGTRAELVAELRKTAAVVDRVLAGLDEDALARDYTALKPGLTVRTDRTLLHLLTHLGFHLGQAGYLRRTLTADATSTGAISLDALRG